MPDPRLTLVSFMLCTAMACVGDNTTPEDAPDALSADAAPPADFSAGQAAYELHCAACHGDDGLGTDSGPGILHELHHSDAQLVQFVLGGKGTMQAVAIPEADAQRIIDYLRNVLSQTSH